MTTKIHLVGKNKVLPDQIIFFKADVNYTEAFLLSGEKIMISKTLKNIEKSITSSSDFFRPHKSFLINLSHVKGFRPNDDTNKINLTNNFQVVLSRRKKNLFLEEIKKYI